MAAARKRKEQESQLPELRLPRAVTLASCSHAHIGPWLQEVAAVGGTRALEHVWLDENWPGNARHRARLRTLWLQLHRDAERREFRARGDSFSGRVKQ
jgi:hypothetical protein